MPPRTHALCLVLVLVLSVVGVGVTPTAAAQTAGEPTRIDSCTTITEPGRYVLTQDIENATGTCIDIRASDVVLDGNGHTIGGAQNESTIGEFVNVSYGVPPEAENGTNASVENATADPANPRFANVGVAANAPGGLSNVTVTAVTVRDFFFGVYFDHVTDGTVSNATVRGNGDGLELYNSTDLTVTDSTLTENAWGLFTLNVTDSELSKLTADGNSETGLYVSSSENVTVVRSTANGNGASGIILDLTNDSTVTHTVTNDNRYGGVPIFLSSNNIIANLTAVGNGHDGVGLYENSTGNLVSDSTVANTTGRDAISEMLGFSAGITVGNSSSDNRIVNVVARNNTEWAYYAVNRSANNSVRNFTVAGANATVSFRGTDIALDAAEQRPEPPSGHATTGTYLNVTNTSPDAHVFLNVSYQPSALGDIREGTLSLWEYENGNWTEVDGVTGVNAEENYVYGNVTSFSVFAPVGRVSGNQTGTSTGTSTGTDTGTPSGTSTPGDVAVGRSPG